MAAHAKQAQPESFTAANGITLLPGGSLSWDDRDADFAAQVAAREEARLDGFDMSFAAQREFAIELPERTLADVIREGLAPLSAEEFELAKLPHPHVFQNGDRGAFPGREVGILGAKGKEGKTTAMVAIAECSALGKPFGGMMPNGPVTTIILSAEDNREQYARKIMAQTLSYSAADKRAVVERVRVFDFEHKELGSNRKLVIVFQGRPMEANAFVDAFIEAVKPWTDPTLPAPLGLIIAETASTLSEGDEGNMAHGVLAAALKRIARALNVAVILVHHTSQAADANLRTLEISAADIRGGTALTFNTRQTWMLINLGSDAKPKPDSDSRAVLRKMVAPGIRDRISALICLDSSKCEDPPPVFFRWEHTQYGSRQTELAVPADLRGLQWEELHRRLSGARADARQSARDEKQQIEVQRVVATVKRLHEEGRQPSAKAVSTALGRTPGWSTPHLGVAVSEGLLVTTEEHVPRTRGLIVIYRPRAD